MAHWENKGNTDEWYTPKYIFDALQVEFHVDVASPEDRTFCHVPAKVFITKNSLYSNWGGFAWMNPPFGGRNALIPWLNKMYQHGNGIALTPDRTSAPWWQDAAKKADAILLVGKKVKFIKPDGSTGNSPGTGTTLFGYGERAVLSLIKAEENGLGILFNRLNTAM